MVIEDSDEKEVREFLPADSRIPSIFLRLKNVIHYYYYSYKLNYKE